MPKTVALSDDTHTLITEKKLELFREHRVTAKIADIVDAAIRYGINSVDKVFVPGKETPKLKTIDKEDMK